MNLPILPRAAANDDDALCPDVIAEVAVPVCAIEDGLHWLFDQSPVALAVLDIEGRVLQANGALLRLLGETDEAVVGKFLVNHVRPEDRDDVNGQLSKLVMRAARAVKLDSVQLSVDKGVGQRTVNLYGRAVPSVVEGQRYLLVHLIDITDRLDLQAQVAHAQKMQAVGQLAGGIAHDFNNLLTAMLGFCDLLLARHCPEDADYGDLAEIRLNSLRAARLVSQLLAFSRRQTLQPTVVNVARSLDELAKMLKRLLGERIRLTVEPVPDGAMVRVDPGQFDQVIINLAVNARDAMPNGGDLNIRTTLIDLDGFVERGVEIMPPDRYVHIAVTDTGVGIPKDIIGRIFDPFFSTKEPGSGTGLGLATVYGIVHQTEGFVFVDSAVGEGATFSIYLPAAGEDAFPLGACGSVSSMQVAMPVAMPDAEPPDLPTTAGTPRRASDAAPRILLVEDEDAVRAFAVRALSAKGYTVLPAANGEAAIDILADTSAGVDLVITDVVMPGIDGPTLVREARDSSPTLKVIFMSGYADGAFDEIPAFDACTHFLQKPFTLTALLAEVDAILLQTNDGNGAP